MKTSTSVFFCALLLPGILLRSTAAPADLDLSFDPGSGLNDRRVNCLLALALQPDGRVILGGTFSTVPGMTCSGLARFWPDGRVDTSFGPALGATSDGPCVSCAAVLIDGKILIGGYFASVNGVARTNLARLNSDGSLDNSFLFNLAGPDQGVHCISLQSDGKILIGGRFISVNGVACGRLARLNPDGTLDTSFLNGLAGAVGRDDCIYGILVRENGDIYVAGSFQAFNSVTRPNLARLNPDGSLDPAFLNGLTGPEGIFTPVKGLAIQKDGKLLIGGYFRSVNGTPRSGTARLNPDGSLDTAFVANVEHSYSLPTFALLDDGKILLAGSFYNVNGDPHGCLVRLNPDGSVDNSFIDCLQQYMDFGVECMQLLPDGKILAAGNFIYTTTSAAGTRFCRLNSDGSIDTTFNLGRTGPQSEIRGMVVQTDGRVLIGGAFSSVSGLPRGCLARLNADGSLDSGFLNGLSGTEDCVYTVAAQPDGRVLVGGDFHSFNGIGVEGLVRLNADGTTDNTFSNKFKGYPLAFGLQPDGKILVVGSFTITNSPARTNLARLNPDGSVDPTFVCTLNDSVRNWYDVQGIAIQADGKILIGGTFDAVNGVSRPGLARLNPDGSLDNSFLNGMSILGTSAECLVIQPDGMILIGGSGLVRLHTDGSPDTSFLHGMAGPNYGCAALALQTDGKIVVAGSFTTFNGVPRPRLARLLPDGSLDPTFADTQPGPNDLPSQIALQPDGKILIAGYFTTFNNTPRAFLARLMGTYAPPTILTDPKSQTAETGSTARFTVRASGSDPLNFQWFLGGTNCISSGLTCSNLILTSLSGSESGPYTVVVTNTSGAVTSAPALLSVIAPVPRRLVPGLTLSATPGVTLNVDYAESLASPPLPSAPWTLLDTITVTDSPLYCFDLSSPLATQRFYRTSTAAPSAPMSILGFRFVPALTLTSSVGNSLRVEAINPIGPVDAWFPVATVTLTNSSQLYFDVSAIGQPAKLYRLIAAP